MTRTLIRATTTKINSSPPGMAVLHHGMRCDAHKPITALSAAISPSRTRRRLEAASRSSRRRSLTAARRVCGVDTSKDAISSRS